MGLFENWNENKFNVYKSEEKTVLKLLEVVSNWLDTIITKVDELDRTKMLSSDMANKYKMSETADFRGTWFGFNNPIASDVGLATAVDNITKNTAQLLSVENYPLIVPEVDDTLRVQRALNGANGKTVVFERNTTYTIGKVTLNDKQKLLILGTINSTDSLSDMMFYATDKDKITILGDAIGNINGNTVDTLSGIVLNNCTNFLISGLEIKNTLNKGVSVIGTSSDGVIYKNSISGCSGTTGGGVSVNGVNIKRIIIAFNRVKTSRIGIVTNGGSDHVIDSNLCYDNSLAGIMLDGVVTASGDGTTNSIVSKNIVRGCTVATYGGIYLGNGAKYNTITGNQCNGNARSGIRFSGGVGYEPSNNIVCNNVCKDNAYHGLEISYGVNTLALQNNLSYNTQKGITASYSDESMINENQVNHNTTTGILIQSGQCKVSHNKCKYNDKGIEIAFGGSTPSGNIVTDNDCASNTTSQIVNASTNTYKNNVGYVNENCGVSTQNGDGTTKIFNIAHGLATTPKMANVQPNSANCIGIFFVTFDATNIIVTYDTAPPNVVNGVKLIWRAQL